MKHTVVRTYRPAERCLFPNGILFSMFLREASDVENLNTMDPKYQSNSLSSLMQNLYWFYLRIKFYLWTAGTCSWKGMTHCKNTDFNVSNTYAGIARDGPIQNAQYTSPVWKLCSCNDFLVEISQSAKCSNSAENLYGLPKAFWSRTAVSDSRRKPITMYF